MLELIRKDFVPENSERGVSNVWWYQGIWDGVWGVGGREDETGKDAGFLATLGPLPDL